MIDEVVDLLARSIVFMAWCASLAGLLGLVAQLAGLSGNVGVTRLGNNQSIQAVDVHKDSEAVIVPGELLFAFGRRADVNIAKGDGCS